MSDGTCSRCLWWKRAHPTMDRPLPRHGHCHGLPAFVQRHDRRTFEEERCALFRASVDDEEYRPALDAVDPADGPGGEAGG